MMAGTDRTHEGEAPAARPAELAALLQVAGVEGVDSSTIRRHVEAGCPVRPDGRIDLVAYLAWLLTDERDAESTPVDATTG